jgi:ATP adenylyltransferase
MAHTSPLNTYRADEGKACPFCLKGREVLAESDHAFAILDMFPVNEGHALVIPKRHVAVYFDLSEDEQIACWSLLNEVQRLIAQRHHPDGFNVGINAGIAAGQTIHHVHIHLIPRYTGDVPDPRGGVRGVIPDKRSY